MFPFAISFSLKCCVVSGKSSTPLLRSCRWPSVPKRKSVVVQEGWRCYEAYGSHYSRQSCALLETIEGTEVVNVLGIWRGLGR